MIGDYKSVSDIGFDYSEQIAAMYISAAKQFGAHWNAKLGLRGELTYAKGLFEQGAERQEITQKPYFNLFPTVFIGYNPTEDWSLSVSYTRRIKRPSYWTLNPFVRYIDAHTYEVGNPDLKPEFNNQVDLNFGWSRYVSVGFNFAHTQQMFTQKIDVLPNGDRKMLWENFGTCTTHGGTLSLTEIPIVPKRNEAGKIDGAWLALTVNANCFHQIHRATDNSYVRRSVFGSVYGCFTAYLPADIQLSLDGNYDTPSIDGYTRWGSGYGLNFGFKKQFLHRTLTLSVNVNDILRSMKWKEETLGMAEGYYNKTAFEMVGSQRVSVGITFLFGQYQQHKYRKVGDDEESSRLGGGTSTGGRR